LVTGERNTCEIAIITFIINCHVKDEVTSGNNIALGKKKTQLVGSSLFVYTMSTQYCHFIFVILLAFQYCDEAPLDMVIANLGSV
jgi:hypothetical protein